MTFTLLAGILPTIAMLAACHSPAAAQVTPAAPDPVSVRIELAVNRVLGERGIPGAAVAVLVRDSVLVLRGFGVSDRERGTQVTPQTIFQIASLTKPLTATAVLLLVEDGKLDLDAPASRYLDWLPDRYSAVTIRQLLHHTAGVAPDMRRENVDEMTEAEFRRRFSDRSGSFPPGTSWQYANAGYTLLAQIVERVSGQSFGDYVQRRVAAPLGMVHTGYRVPQKDDRSHAVGYDLVDGALLRAPHVFSGWGNSGIESTVADLSEWAKAMARGRLLSQSSYRAMFSSGRITPDTVLNFPFRAGRSGYGLGWFLMSERGDSLVSHGGAIAGFSSVLTRVPKRGWTVIVLSNMKQGNDRQGQAEAIAAAILEVLRVQGPGS